MHHHFWADPASDSRQRRLEVLGRMGIDQGAGVGGLKHALELDHLGAIVMV